LSTISRRNRSAAIYYQDAILSGSGVDYWSSSRYTGTPWDAWLVEFDRGMVWMNITPQTYSVRCVRRGP
jgi:hypothetical protein